MDAHAISFFGPRGIKGTKRSLWSRNKLFWRRRLPVHPGKSDPVSGQSSIRGPGRHSDLGSHSSVTMLNGGSQLQKRCLTLSVLSRMAETQNAWDPRRARTYCFSRPSKLQYGNFCGATRTRLQLLCASGETRPYRMLFGITRSIWDWRKWMILSPRRTSP